MSQSKSTLRISHFPDLRILTKTSLASEMEAFLIDRQARGLSSGSLRFYTQKLLPPRLYLESKGITEVEAITPPIVRRFLLEFSKNHNQGGVHAVYRTLKAFLRWYEMEAEPEGWKNPMVKVRAPKVGQEPLEPVGLGELQALLSTCAGKSLADRRDRAILLVLLDTGVRASEFVALNLGDVDMGAGSVLVRHGKGNKVRTVFVGSKTRRVLLSYLRLRKDISESDPLFATLEGNRLSYPGLRDVIRRRAKAAGIVSPTLHSFRRTFALTCLRNDVDIYSLQRLMGHTSLAVLRRYLAQTDGDLQRAHQRGGPVDNLL